MANLTANIKVFGKKILFKARTICENNSNIDFTFLKLENQKFNALAIEADEILDVCKHYQPFVG